MRWPFAAAIAGLAIASSTRAVADGASASRRAAAAREMDRPYTQAELSGGFLTLPAAEVCPSGNDCSHGETTLAFGIRNIFRFQRFGVGAGIQWATTLRADAGERTVDPTLERNHSRRYFLVEAIGRYAFLQRSTWEIWAGPTVGAVIVNDSWSVKADREPYSDTAFVGPRAATIGTEGLTAGAAIGVAWSFTTNWALGSQLRYSSWFLPQTAEIAPTKDVASLHGHVDMIDIGFSIAYRIAL